MDMLRCCLPWMVKSKRDKRAGSKSVGEEDITKSMDENTKKPDILELQLIPGKSTPQVDPISENENKPRPADEPAITVASDIFEPKQESTPSSDAKVDHDTGNTTPEPAGIPAVPANDSNTPSGVENVEKSPTPAPEETTSTISEIDSNAPSEGTDSVENVEKSETPAPDETSSITSESETSDSPEIVQSEPVLE